MNPIAEAFSSQQLLSLAVVVLAVVVVANMGWRRRSADGSPKQYRREIDSAVGQSAAVNREMERLLVELEEMARKINAQIETRFAKLEQSIADADRRIAAMRILIDEAKRTAGTAANVSDAQVGEQADTTARSGESVANAPGSQGPVRPSTESRRLDGVPSSRPDSNPSLPTDSSTLPSDLSQPGATRSSFAGPPLQDVGQAGLNGRTAGPPAPLDEEDLRRHRIHELADSGLSPLQIAQQLREPVGEVELILNLRQASG